VLVPVPVLVPVLVLVLVHESTQPPRHPDDKAGVLDYQRLDAYQCALQFAGLAFQIIKALPRGNSALADQLRRATMSIPLNIAEGSGKTTAKERRRYHAIARGSAMECGAILDVLRLQDLHPQADSKAEEARTLLVRIVSMLTRMCR